ncbi:hypothetical protein K1T71_005087 [Dendrolimus kikuchii]|uniref:Uncharacterized protein n=1 Tax=Dendrolimus kikuchii TaxID=765133 RepID=A0ACC1D6E4_9NEOP|nr:hypothetical protein K1T71_005087 [Dendrolimus kikuchii]
MDKYLRPERFDVDPGNSSASEEFVHWLFTFKNFLNANDKPEDKLSDSLKLTLLANHISPKVFQYTGECKAYVNALSKLEKNYIKPKNEISARYALASRKQQSNENVQDYLQVLKMLSKDCGFKSVNAETNRDDYVRDAFISGLTSNKIRERLLENITLTLDDAFNQALSLETAESNAQRFVSHPSASTSNDTTTMGTPREGELNASLSKFRPPYKHHCFFSGANVHIRQKCPALNEAFETDASEHSIAATLSQEVRPVAFFSKTLSQSERQYSAIEKEAQAIVESLKKWRNFLIGRPFRLITDQRSVSFMFDRTHSSKIKNEKIQRWRLELSCFKYDIIYRPGKENVVPDAFSRVCSTVAEEWKLKELHNSLCHPGIARMLHWVRSKNLPYSVEDIRKVTNSCTTCSMVKPRFHKSSGVLIKAMAPLERLNIDFKGPLPSASSNKYLLTVIDEYSRFPLAFPCKDVSASTVIKQLNKVFCLFGMPNYIHSDRGAAFMSKELKDFLQSKGIATSRTTAYNPEVDLLESNSTYSFVSLPDGRETTVSNRHLAPVPRHGTDDSTGELVPECSETTTSSERSFIESTDSQTLDSADSTKAADTSSNLEIPIRHSTRVRRPPAHLKDYCG